MKKGLLLSVVASTMIFAGGDIAPVEPAAPAPAADCSDFYGSVGAYYQTISSKDVALSATSKKDNLFGKENSNFDVTATIGVEKQLFAGIGFGAEVSGWSAISSSIAAAHRVDGSALGTPVNNRDGGALTQAYLTASFGNTAIKAGRFMLPGSLSPLLRTGTTAGVKNMTFDGALVANTDITDTTVYGVWVYGVSSNTANKVAGIALAKNTSYKIGFAGDEKGAFAFGIQNKSLANTTITAVGYYAKDFDVGALAGKKGVTLQAGAVNVDTAIAGYDISAQYTYLNLDKLAAAVKATSTAGLKVSTTYGDLDVMVAAAYENDGTLPATIAGGNGALIGDQIDFVYGKGGTAVESYAVGAEIGYKVWKGRAYGRVSYQDFKSAATKSKIANGIDNKTLATAGYKFKVADIDFKAEYQYGLIKYNTGTPADLKTNRVRLEAAYKF